jgi:cytosine/adenosine deaminase-related metal-dependent hydrolase
MILLKNCYRILTPESCQGLEGHDILIQGNRIERIAPRIALPSTGPDAVDSGIEIIECSRMVVVPGFVNTHHHFYQTLTRNLASVQNEKLFTWLRFLYDVWKHIDEDAVYYSSLLAIGELLKTGCTCSLDHHYLFPHGVKEDLVGVQFEAAQKLGIRFCPCRGSMSLSVKDGGLPPDSVVQTTDEILSDSKKVIERYHDGSDFSMHRILLAPCSPFSVTEDLMTESAGLARQYGVRLHTHLAETADENEYCLKHYGRRPLRLMMDLDFIGEDVSYAHGIFFTDEELDLLAQTRASIAHCPSSNMRLGSGIARVREMLDRGINVALAVDGSASNDTSDFLGEMRVALLLQRVRYGPSAMTVSDVLRMATEHGARLLGYNRIGSIRESWAADLALFDVHRLEYAGALSDPIAALLFAGFNHSTAYTIVNGRIVVREGRLTGYDEEDLFWKAHEVSCALLNKI